MKKKNLKKKQDNSNLNFFKTLLTSLAVILIFSVLPNLLSFMKTNLNSNKVVFNSSKQNFDEILDKQKKKNKIIKDSIKDRYSWNIFEDIDVFGKNEEDEDPQRLSASTIEELFKDNGYDLDTVKKTKLVNAGNQLTKLPKELQNIESPKKRKKLFIKIVLPLIIEENLKIRFDRKKLFKILNKNNTSQRDKAWLELKFKQYGVKNNDLAKLKIRMDEIPISLSIAQAAKETGWGSSRFAQEGNALFGQWTWSGEGIKPLEIEKDKRGLPVIISNDKFRREKSDDTLIGDKNRRSWFGRWLDKHTFTYNWNRGKLTLNSRTPPPIKFRTHKVLSYVHVYPEVEILRHDCINKVVEKIYLLIINV